MRLVTDAGETGDAGTPGRLVSITIVYSLPEAAVMRATLTAHGIPCYALGERMAFTDWYYLAALGGIPICIPESLKDEAVALIPDLAAPRTRKEIVAETRANGGPFIRRRLIIAHLIFPALSLISMLPYHLIVIPALIAQEPLTLADYLLALIIDLLSWFLLPFL